MTAYLDIETSWSGEVTVVGVYIPGSGTRQIIKPDVSAAAVMELLSGVSRLVTYNGSRFDLPVLNRRLGTDLPGKLRHDDLMVRCWRHDLKGGLKKVEVLLDIPRDTEGLTSLDAPRLWDAYRAGRRDALDLLLRYNREDVENLEVLERKLDKLPPRASNRRPGNSSAGA
ncbi:MAG: ribonuclease H-like domain-containing protein [Elusimicrobiota bacterium]